MFHGLWSWLISRALATMRRRSPAGFAMLAAEASRPWGSVVVTLGISHETRGEQSVNCSVNRYEKLCLGR